jgi:hypothetical protein
MAWLVQVCAGKMHFYPKQRNIDAIAATICRMHKAQSYPKLQSPHALGTLNCKLIIRNVQATNLMEVLS